MQFMLALVTAYIAFWASYLVAVPVYSMFRPGKSLNNGITLKERYPTVAIVVPAHNMASYIARCVNSLNSCDYPNDQFEIFVIADHCTDGTAAGAREAGAVVLTRDVTPRGKTYSIEWALNALASRGTDPDLYVIVDATVRVDHRFLVALAARLRQGEDIVVGHAVVDPENQQWFAQCLGLSLAHRNLQNSCRERLGLSALIEGRGMAYSRRYVRRFGWSLARPEPSSSNSHPTEDWRHGVRAVEHGIRVAYADDAMIFTPLRESLEAATQQGVRWERGRLVNAVTYGLQLLLCGLRQRNRTKVLAALDAIQPPVAILGGLCASIAVLAVFFAGNRLGVLLGITPIIFLGLYALAVFWRGLREGIRPIVILWTPVFVVWRCLSFILAMGVRDGRKTSEHDKASN